MKKQLSLLLITLLCFLTAQTQQISIGATGVSGVFHDLKLDPNDGGTIYVGTRSTGGITDCYLVKLNAARAVVWQRTIQNPGNDALYRVRVCANGDYIAAGQYFQNGRIRGLVCRVNATNGNIIWATTTAPMNTANGDIFYDLIEMANQNIAAVGVADFLPGSTNGLVALLAPNGTEIIKRTCSFFNSDEFKTIAQLPNGTLVVNGNYWPGGFYEAFVYELNPATLAVNAQFNYRVNLNVTGVNPTVNALWPVRSYVVNNNVVMDMFGVTGFGTGNDIQFVYTYTPGTGNLTGNFFFHNNNAGIFTTFPIAANDYIITQSNGSAAQYVSRITNGVTVYDRQILNNTVSDIRSSDIRNSSLLLAGATPGSDAYGMFSNINFPVSANPCPVVNSNTLVNVLNTPTPVNNAFPLNVNSILCTQPNLTTAIPNNPVNNLCGPPCPSDTTINITKCDIEDVVLTARAGVSYSWSPATGLSSTTIQNPTCTATSNIVYTATITDAFNCVYNDVFNVTVNSCHCEDSCNWSLSGNTFVKNWNFIGSLNNADFKIRTNNIQRAVVTSSGNVGINTPTPAKLLHVNGEARIGVLPAAAPNERLVFANAAGDLRTLATTGNTGEYLSGDGTWQTLTGGGGGVTGADQGLTLDGTTAVLGTSCNRGGIGGEFQEHRLVNMNNNNLYFNSSEEGKLYMGISTSPFDGCRTLYTRLEISSKGLPTAANDYLSPDPSTSGLRFTNLTSKDRPITNKTRGVLSLDEDGDVIWVNACCEKLGGGVEVEQLKSILDRLDKLEKEVKDSRAEAVTLRAQLTQMDVVLGRTNSIVLNQNVPNPFAESTVITYSIPASFGKAQLVFSTVNGVTIKTIDIKVSGKGQVNVFASDISSGLYFYTLVVDGKQIERKKMIKQ